MAGEGSITLYRVRVQYGYTPAYVAPGGPDSAVRLVDTVIMGGAADTEARQPGDTLLALPDTEVRVYE
jgi:hypothetical protein